MDKKTILRDYRQKYHIFNEDYTRIDSNIQPLVDWVRKQGFITFASCGSHIFDYNGKPCFCGQAYVAFYYTQENKAKLEELQKIKLPENNNYKIIWDELNDGLSRTSFNILFRTRYNRIRDLKKIYDALGVTYSKDIKLERQRPTYKVLESQGKTIYKNYLTMI